MTEHPIILSTEMVRAILDGRKTQTRRIVKPQPFRDEVKKQWVYRYPSRKKKSLHSPNATEALKDICPYGKVGDRLWAKEDYEYIIQDDMVITYYKHSYKNNRVNYTPINCLPEETRKKLIKGKQDVWKSKLLMFKFMARIWLEITNIRVERVQDIRLDDCKAEGISNDPTEDWLELFMELWDTLNSKRGYGWDKNPWCWCITFKRTERK